MVVNSARTYSTEAMCAPYRPQLRAELLQLCRILLRETALACVEPHVTASVQSCIAVLQRSDVADDAAMHCVYEEMTAHRR